MKNYVQSGNSLTFIAAADIVAGQGILQGALFGIASTNAETGAEFEAALVGVYDLPKTGGAVALGAKAYWSAGDSAVTGTASGNTLIGAFTKSADAGATMISVRLNGTA